MIFRRVLVTFLCALLAVALAYGVLTWRELRRARDQAQEARSRLSTANAALSDAQAQVDAAQDTYYRLAGWDVATGNPTSQRLRELGLGWSV